ncbi:hypothetical protein K0651_05430 [Ornithinimicrobium sp. Arc0846-15]|nr:hypothetical protein [Ornithinimicrobium laminariae]
MAELSPSEAARESWLADMAVLAPVAGEQLWEAELELLLSAWSESHRAYHNEQHLQEMLFALDCLSGTLTEVEHRIARIAAWFHDLAYNPRAQAGSNEYRSATKARDHLHRLGVEGDVVDAVEALILATVSHDGIEGGLVSSALSAAFNDADLWILSAPPRRYAEYARDVRTEYAHVPDAIFAAGRTQIMAALIDRPQVYATAKAQAEWEAAAHANISAELAALR